MLTLLMFALSLRPAFAADDAPAAAPTELTFRGKLITADTHKKGDVTVGKKSISVELKGVFKTQSHAYSYTKMSSVHAQRGLFHTKIIMVMEGKDADATVSIITKPKYYKDVDALLKDKL